MNELENSVCCVELPQCFKGLPNLDDFKQLQIMILFFSDLVLVDSIAAAKSIQA